MKTRAWIMLVLLTITSIGYGQSARKQRKADEATKAWRYEIECVGIGKDGTYLIKVWSYSKNPTIATTQAKKMPYMVSFLKDFLVADKVVHRNVR